MRVDPHRFQEQDGNTNLRRARTRNYGNWDVCSTHFLSNLPASID